MKKFLRILGIILLVLIIVVLVYVARNYLIISILQNKNKEYLGISNFHIIAIAKDDNVNYKNVVNYYQKGDDYVSIIETINGDNFNTKLSQYKIGKSSRLYVIAPDGTKTASLNAGVVYQNSLLSNELHEETFLHKIRNICVSKILSVEIEGKKCYKIVDFESPTAMFGIETNEFYIEKDTGLLIRQVIDNTIINKEYEFDTVDDSIFIEPDISEYTVQENT